ncbi:SPOSA6832_00445 [Sporobolomyces salmonicolor]|uniref:SPOSA6832_00445-mRNA-1:cds n=1 Tax=Sporidiobolus salmonicolor TaxID=5005 RepID=A0A0D6EGQ3_SPOSA|nr:SPOSA6832_00445 [Sporobolomyces salmonicolor]
MRGRMRDPSTSLSAPRDGLKRIQPFSSTGAASYNQAFTLGKPLETLAVGEVIKSEHPDVKVGALYRGRFDFAEYAVVPGETVKQGTVLENKEGLPATNLVGSVGMPGATAWVGLYEIGKIKKGETIFISAASGAVGQIAGQLAKREGLKVIGSAGSDSKVAFLKEIGFDVAFNYKTEDTQAVLEANPFSLYFDNVGGATLDAVLATIQPGGRIIGCGSVSRFIVFMHDLTEFQKVMPGLVKNGEIKIKEHVTKGIDNGEAFLDMLEGRNEGKAVISLE